MDRLYLLRHGIAVPHGTPDIADDDRPLTKTGERRVEQIGHGLADLGIKLDRIITSPLPRAQKTAEIVAGVLGLSDILEVADELRAGRPASSIRSWLETRTESRVMIVGHDPSFTDLIGLLVTGKEGLPIATLRKGGMAAFTADPGGTWRLDWLARPKLLRRLG